METLVLASSSPRRAQILSDLGLLFTIDPPPCNEDHFLWSGQWHQDVEQMARCKAQSLEQKRNHFILAADTTVVVKNLEGNEVRLGKPRSMEQALSHISLLQGTTHQVYTGVALGRAERYQTGFSVTHVKMRPLSLEQQVAYLKRFDPLDKAGAYAIQEGGCIAVEEISGCYCNVKGLPLKPLHELFALWGIDLHLPPDSMRAPSFETLASSNKAPAEETRG